MAKKEAKGSKKVAVQPLGDRVLVKPLQGDDTKSPGGIIIPDSAKKEKPEKGTVIAVGEGKRTERGDVLPLRVQAGDTVMFSKYGFDEVEIEGEEYYILSESSILAVIK